jgi:citrate lyase beta subunit
MSSTTLTTEFTQTLFDRLKSANASFARRYPGESHARQPVHTVYGGAQIFKSDTAAKLGTVALKSLLEYAPTFVDFTRALGLSGSSSLPRSAARAKALVRKLEKSPESVRNSDLHARLAHSVYARVVEKLRREPVEDFRIDFEDGYGNRLDDEEDYHAALTADEVGRGMTEGTLPPFIGIRVKPFTEDLKARAIRTLDVFLTRLLQSTHGKLPDNFVVTIPKVTMPEHVAAVVRAFNMFESRFGMPEGSLKLEIMVETPQSIFDHRGMVALPAIVEAAEGRCVAAHFGVYDYTASNNITARHQTMDHPACDFARTVMKVALTGTGIWLSDGATNVMPVGHHRPVKGKRLTPRQQRENREVVHRAWKLGFDHINHSLMNGYYQGWDLHPAQFPVRYAAVYAFFLENLDEASLRLKTFVEKAAQASLIGDVFDDAATGQGLLNFFLRGISCGAITEAEAQATGLSLEELRSRSFLKILERRRTNIDPRRSKAISS